jgi:hypothetical protein
LSFKNWAKARGTGSRRGYFGVGTIPQLYAVKPITVMNYLLYCPQVYNSMSPYLHKRIPTEPAYKIRQWIICRELFTNCMNPTAPIPSDDRRNFMASQKSDLVAIRIFDRQQIALEPVGRCLFGLPRRGKAWSFKRAELRQQPVNRFGHLRRVERFQKIVHCIQSEGIRRSAGISCCENQVRRLREHRELRRQRNAVFAWEINIDENNVRPHVSTETQACNAIFRGPNDLHLASIIQQGCQILGGQRLIFNYDSSNSNPHTKKC